MGAKVGHGQRRNRIGLIGLGAVGNAHFRSYRLSEKLDVVAACDTNPSTLGSLQGSDGVQLYDDPHALLKNPDVDVVCVLTPAATHESLVVAAAAAGKHVLCEKPMSLSIESCDRMIAACDEAKVQFFYGSSYRFLPALRAARSLVQQGAIGAVRLMREDMIGGSGPAAQEPFSFAHYPPGGPGGTGSGLVDHGIHLIDIFSWLAAAPVSSAKGYGNRSGGPLRPEHLVMELEGGALGILIYDDGTFPTVLPSDGAFSDGAWSFDGIRGGCWDPQPGVIHVHGDKGAIRVGHYANCLHVTDERGTRQIRVSGDPAPAHFSAQLQSFIEEIEAGRSSRTAEDGREALRVLLEAYR